MPAYVIYINGWPGVGKLTVALQLQKLIPGSYEYLSLPYDGILTFLDVLRQVLHNHELIDPVEKECRRGRAYYQQKRAEFRQRRLKPIKEDPRLRDTVYIFTDSQTEYNECVSDYTDLNMGEHARRFYSVILHCDLDENIRRLTLPGRGGPMNGRLTDAKILEEYRSRDGIFKFGDDDEIEVDVTEMTAEDTAKKIKAFMARREREGRSQTDQESF